MQSRGCAQVATILRRSVLFVPDFRASVSQKASQVCLSSFLIPGGVSRSLRRGRPTEGVRFALAAPNGRRMWRAGAEVISSEGRDAGGNESLPQVRPGAAGRSAMRRRACDWLEAERAAWSSALRHGPPEDRARIQATLRHWKQDPDLAGIRAPEALARLPEPERQRWQARWAQADAPHPRGRHQPARAVKDAGGDVARGLSRLCVDIFQHERRGDSAT